MMTWVEWWQPVLASTFKALGFTTDNLESHLRVFSQKTNEICLSLKNITLAASLRFDSNIEKASAKAWGLGNHYKDIKIVQKR